MNQTMKLWKMFIEEKLRKETQIADNKFGIMPGG
jgi:hypothetical protein